MTYPVNLRPVGGCTFQVELGEAFLGTVEAGEIDDEGQWVGDLDDVIEAAREAYGRHLPPDASFQEII